MQPLAIRGLVDSDVQRGCIFPIVHLCGSAFHYSSSWFSLPPAGRGRAASELREN